MNKNNRNTYAYLQAKRKDGKCRTDRIGFPSLRLGNFSNPS